MPRSLGTLPIPAQELRDLRERLAPYHSTLWQQGEWSILVAVIPGREPDLVNDVERVAELADVRHAQGARDCILLTSGKFHTVPLGPIKERVQQRIRTDRIHAERLRAEMAAELGHRLYRAKDDPMRRIRLGIRVPVGSVRQISEATMDDIAVRLEGQIRTGLADVHCIHLVADTDQVRIETDEFADDMLERLEDPVRRDHARERAASQGVHLAADVGEEPSSPLLADMYARIDALADDVEAPAPVHRQQAAVATLRGRLRDSGFALRVEPRVPGCRLELAADRLDRHPQKIIVLAADRFDGDMAERALTASRDLGTDLTLVVAPTMDEEASKRIAATRVKHITPEHAQRLQL